ncbi:hypothetical protein L226DRAFT_398779 [Lentinus tigrinus ALCF2SS1-7]|uniref:uncharacterized protein n=1 Tax=Lentinus tigrinus ALCF2SS1-7 TaxID=1328758 RepID=UPI001165DEDC|nr:hypothetical protein L226DRAFT_398779 [Lentinus tigrinus ALCF2SS1-7]
MAVRIRRRCCGTLLSSSYKLRWIVRSVAVLIYLAAVIQDYLHSTVYPHPPDTLRCCCRSAPARLRQSFARVLSFATTVLDPVLLVIVLYTADLEWLCKLGVASVCAWRTDVHGRMRMCPLGG